MSVGEAVSRFPRERTWLLPALQSAQRAEGWLSPETLAAVAAHLRVPRSEVWGVASHYPELRLAKPGRRVVRVCTGVACVARGGERLLARCEERLGIRAGETTRDGTVTLEAMDCAFACAVAPVVEADHAYRGRVSEAALDALLDTPAAHVVPAPLTGRGGPPATPVTAGSPGARFTVLRREAERRRTGSRLAVGVGTCGLAVGAGETLEALRVEVQRRGLAWTVVAAGCNGMCWAAPVVEVLRDGKPPITAARVRPPAVSRLLNALAANMAERDFAAPPDWMAAQHRVLTERCGLADPYDVADALRHGTYATLARVLEDGRPEAVIEEVRAGGLAGRGGAYFQTAVKWAACRAAAGAPKYLVVHGEETALLESIEGRRAMPRTRPPFPVESGLFGKPTVINNVETLFAVVPIVARGGAAFAALGGGRGTKLFGLSGNLRRPGVVEMEVGCTLRTLIDEVGGGGDVGSIGAVVLGGPSGSVVPPRQFDEPLVPRGAVNPGTGGVVALGDAAGVRDAVRTLLAFNARESCGKCTPCREGTARMLALPDEPEIDVARVQALAETVQLASLCGLGQAAPLAVLSGLAEFPREFGVS